MGAAISRHPFWALSAGMVVTFALVALADHEPIQFVAALGFLVSASLTLTLGALRLAERAPERWWRYPYFLLIGTATWGIAEVVLLGSAIDAPATWLWVAAMVWPFIFLVYWFESRRPAVPPKAIFEAIPRRQFWLLILGALGLLAATWPIPSEYVRAPLLMATVAGLGVAIERIGRANL